MSDYRQALFAFIVQSIKAGHDVDEVIFHQHWDEEMLKLAGVNITDEFVNGALDPDVWVKMVAGQTSHAKKYDYPDPNVPCNSDGAMVGSYADVTGVKDITFRDDNAGKGLPTSFCDAMLRHRSNGKRFFSAEAITASDKRTGWFARAFAIIAPGLIDAVGFQVGNGSVGMSCLDFLNLREDTYKAFKVFYVTARKVEKNKQIVDRAAPHMKFRLVAADDHTALREGGKFLITAASGDVPVVKTEDVPDDCHILSQGRKDLEPSLIERRYNMPNHIFIGDNFKAMEERNIDPLSFWAASKGQQHCL